MSLPSTDSETLFPAFLSNALAVVAISTNNEIKIDFIITKFFKLISDCKDNIYIYISNK